VLPLLLFRVSNPNRSGAFSRSQIFKFPSKVGLVVVKVVALPEEKDDDDDDEFKEESRTTR